MDITTWISTYWQPLLIGAVFGLVLGWLVEWLPNRSKFRAFEKRISELEERLRHGDKALAESQREAENLARMVQFLESRSAPRGGSTDMRQSLERELNEQSQVCDTLTKSIAAIDSELDRTFDSQQRIALNTRRKELTAKRTVVVGRLGSIIDELAKLERT